VICTDCQQRDVCDLAGKDAPLLTGCDASHGTWAFDRLRLDRMTADRDALRSELDDMRAAVEWIQSTPPEERASEELIAAAGVDFRRLQRNQGPGAVGNRPIRFEDLLVFHARQQGRNEARAELERTKEELGRVRRNHLRNQLRRAELAAKTFAHIARQDPAYSMVTLRRLRRAARNRDRWRRVVEAIRAALERKDGA